jgi:ATP-dependent DNA helicase RecG
MDIEKISALVKKSESSTLEYKSSTGQLKPAFATICAFLNGKGGTVLIGVKDKGQIVGQDVTDNTRLEIANGIKKIEPTATIDVHYVEVKNNKFVIAIHVSAGNHIPYIYDGRAFQRDESQTDKMSQHRYEQLLVKRGQLNHSWEEVIAYDYKLSDLSHEEIYKTVADGIRENRIPASAQREDIPQILERLNLTIEGNLKRAAPVLYAKQESMKFSQCMIKMARFKGINKLGDFIDNQQLYGNAFFLLSEADAFLRRHLPIASFFKPDQFKRIDKPALPVMAVREALINALCHRDYAKQGTDISLAIFDDRLEIWNSGTLSKELSIESLRHYHDSILRNKLISHVFYLRGMIEKWGSGTNKMIDLCKEASIPEPKFIERTGGLAVIFKFREPISIISQESKNKISLNVRQEAILHILRNKKPLSAAEIFSKLKNPPSLRTVKSDLSALQELGLVEQQGKGPNTLWKMS